MSYIPVHVGVPLIEVLAPVFDGASTLISYDPLAHWAVRVMPAHFPKVLGWTPLFAVA
jgi:hypothetical protein